MEKPFNEHIRQLRRYEYDGRTPFKVNQKRLVPAGTVYLFFEYYPIQHIGKIYFQDKAGQSIGHPKKFSSEVAETIEKICKKRFGLHLMANGRKQ
ncbi:hypothetical protein COV15_00955 [Candidatus Woesearchaeota archaeon CG10_big_fil_rev_8_21_14_0_10_34_12]|nr:MAG: hypothetical protein COV15_00955 [Candidatus Woesearchaeota archaeon CG10_big_fil_rev_8_21_14_0_10_34_12]